MDKWKLELISHYQNVSYNLFKVHGSWYVVEYYRYARDIMGIKEEDYNYG